MDLTNALKKPFTDLKKLLIGVVLSIFPIINWFAKGYILECSGLGKNKKSAQMPEWKDWGDCFVKGLLSWIVSIIYMIPFCVVILIGAGGILISLIKIYVGKVIPSGTLESVASGQVAPDVLKQLVEQNWAQAIPAFLTLAPIFMVALVLALLAAYVVPSAVLTYINKKDFGAAFSGLVFKKAFTGKYFQSWIVAIVITLVIGMILSWIPLLGQALTYFIGGVIMYTLLGEAYAQA